MRIPGILTLLTTAMTIHSATAAGTSYAGHSVLASGRWVKIKVTDTGIQQITARELASWGFDDPSRVAVFGYGGVTLTDDRLDAAMPDDLPQQPVMVAGDKIIFYGESDLKNVMEGIRSFDAVRNTYSDGGYYFLTDSPQPMRPGTRGCDGGQGTPVAWHYDVTYEEDECQNPAAAGAHFFGPSYDESRRDVRRYMITDYCADNGSAIAWRCAIAADRPTSVTFRRGDDSDSYNINPPAKSGYSYFVVTRNFTVPYREAYSTEGLELTVSASGTPDDGFVATDYSCVSYPRLNRLGGRAQMMMYYPEIAADCRYSLPDAPEGVEVWDVSSYADMCRLSTVAGDNGGRVFTVGKTYKYAAGHTCRIAVFNPEAPLHTVEYAGEVANSNLHGSAVPEMLIVTTENCRRQAERLAGLHRSHDGLDVAVIGQEEILNEFSSGTPDAMALRRLCRMYDDRGDGRLRYLLLFGAGSYDNRGILHQFRQGDELLLTYPARDTEISGTVMASYTCDAYFGITGDSDLGLVIDGEMKIAVGRIPAISEAEATAAVDKIERHMAQPLSPATYSRAIVMADDGDGNSHMLQQEALSSLIRRLSPWVTTHKIYDNIYPLDPVDNLSRSARRVTVRLLQGGAGYFSYAGHGNPRSFSSSEIWSKQMVRSTDYEQYPFAMLATCDSYAFDRMDDGIAHSMLFAADGGMIAVVGAGRTVYKDSNHTLSMAVARQYFGPDAATLGDVYRKAYNEVMAGAMTSGGIQLIYNTACYNLGGDPALPLRRPGAEARITAVSGGIRPTDGEMMHMQAMKFNTISGVIDDGRGEADTSFSGEATITVYDGRHTQRTLSQGDGKADGDKLIDVSFDESPLATVTTPVREGHFSARLYLPKSLEPHRSNRITVTAVSDDGQRAAAGYVPEVTVDEYDPDNTDECTAPSITAMYIGSPDFTDGMEVENGCVLYAVIDPGTAGLLGTAGSVTSPLTLSLDRRKPLTRVMTAYTLGTDGMVRVTLPLGELTPGRHTLYMTARGAAGDVASRQVSFTVTGGAARATLLVDDDPDIGQVTVDIAHAMGGAPVARLVIEDAAGNAVRSIDGCTFPYIWDLTDAGNRRVPDGVYRIHALLTAGAERAATPAANIVVLGGDDRQTIDKK